MINNLTAEDAFTQAIQFCNKHDYGTAVPYFLHAIRETPKNDYRANEYTAFYGLSLMRLGNRDEGFNKCLVAAGSELKNPEVFLCLARASLMLNRRKVAIKAVSQGLTIDPTHVKLKFLRNNMGVRREPIFGFLSRENFINVILGKITYKIRYN